MTPFCFCTYMFNYSLIYTLSEIFQERMKKFFKLLINEAGSHHRFQRIYTEQLCRENS